MAKLQALVCTECGGHIDRDTMTCRYCGIQYKLDEYMRPIIVERRDARVQTIMAMQEVPLEVINHLGCEEASKIAMKEITRKLAEALVPYVEVMAEEDLLRQRKQVYGRVRVVRPDYRFGE